MNDLDEFYNKVGQGKFVGNWITVSRDGTKISLHSLRMYEDIQNHILRFVRANKKEQVEKAIRTSVIETYRGMVDVMMNARSKQ